MFCLIVRLCELMTTGMWPFLATWACFVGLVKLHVTMLYTKYRSFGSFGFREHFFFFHVFPIVSLWQAMAPWGRAFMDSRGTVDRIYKEGYYALLHTKH